MNKASERTPRYLFFVGAMREGGAERVISILTRHMVNRGLDVQIMLYHDYEIFYDIDPRIKTIKVREQTDSNNVLKNLIWIRHYIKSNADVVISFLAPFNMLALLATRGYKGTVIVADRNDPRHVPTKPGVRMIRNCLYRFADGVVVQTKNNQCYFSKAVQRKSAVIYNPIDLGNMRACALTAVKKRQIVSVGRLTEQKKQYHLLQAFAKIHHRFPEHELIIYGEGPCRTALEETAKTLNIDQKVHLPGHTKNVHQEILSAETFVLCSEYEGMPNALIEAMCLGLPVISTRVSGATDLIEHGVNGLLCDVNDSDALAECLVKLLSDPTLATTMSKNAIELNELLSVDEILQQWMTFIQECLDKR